MGRYRAASSQATSQVTGALGDVLAAVQTLQAAGAELLVIDDLSSALDVETERVLWDLLLIGGTVTCLAVSHRRANHIVVLREGRVEAQGTHALLLKGCAEMRAMWHEADDPVSLV